MFPLVIIRSALFQGLLPMLCVPLMKPLEMRIGLQLSRTRKKEQYGLLLLFSVGKVNAFMFLVVSVLLSYCFLILRWPGSICWWWYWKHIWYSRCCSDDMWKGWFWLLCYRDVTVKSCSLTNPVLSGVFDLNVYALFAATSPFESIFHSKNINQYGFWSCKHEVWVPGIIKRKEILTVLIKYP